MPKQPVPFPGEARPLPPLAFGAEKMGLAGVRHPILVAAVAALLLILAGIGIARLKVDDSLSQLFRSETPEFSTYERVTQRFPSTEYDVLVVVEGQTLLERESIEKLRELVSDLQLMEGTRAVISLFSARAPPVGKNPPGPLLPADLPHGTAYEKLIAGVRSNDLIRGKLLSEDGTLALAVLSLDPESIARGQRKEILQQVRTQVAESLGNTGLTWQLSGVPVMQQEIASAVERDRIIYNAGGFLAGCLLAILFFRRVSLMIVAAAPPLAAIALSLGAFGWLDIRLNMFLNVMTPLIMVISFSDSMQLTFVARDRMIAGDDRRQAFAEAIRVAGPACVLTHATAAFSFVALMFARSDLIRTFGMAGLIATLIALAAVLTLVPALGVLLARKPPPHDSHSGVAMLRRFCAFIARGMVRHAAAWSIAALGVVVALVMIYATLQPRYRLADQVPDKQQAVEASNRLDLKLTGANPVDVYIEFPPGASLYDARTLEVIAAAHAALEQQRGIGNVWSLETLRRWLEQRQGKPDDAALKSYVDILPEHLTRRFVSAEQDAVIVSGRTRDIDAGDLLPIIEQVEKSLSDLSKAHPGYRLAVTGLSAVAARNSAGMIGRMNQALTVEIIFVSAFIGLAFRSLLAAVVSLLPGIFPVVAAGGVLALLGNGLPFAAVIALTVSFGLGLSATIHFLNRWRLEDRGDKAESVARTTVLVGPALILTSLVLACALAATTLSDLPSLRMFGWLSAFAVMAALVADFLILRPVMVLALSLTRRGKPPST